MSDIPSIAEFVASQPKGVPSMAEFVASQQPAQPQPKSFSEHLADYWDQVNPVAVARGMASAVNDAPGFLRKWSEGSQKLHDDAVKAYEEGRFADAARHGLGFILNAIPGVGETIDAAGNKMAAGDIGGGLTDTAALATQLFAYPKVMGKIPAAVEGIPGAVQSGKNAAGATGAAVMRGLGDVDLIHPGKTLAAILHEFPDAWKDYQFRQLWDQAFAEDAARTQSRNATLADVRDANAPIITKIQELKDRLTTVQGAPAAGEVSPIAPPEGYVRRTPLPVPVEEQPMQPNEVRQAAADLRARLGMKPVQVAPAPIEPIAGQLPSGRKPGGIANQVPIQEAVPTQNVLDDIAKAQAGKPFDKLTPTDQQAVRNIAAKIDTSGMPKVTVAQGQVRTIPFAKEEVPSQIFEQKNRAIKAGKVAEMLNKHGISLDDAAKMNAEQWAAVEQAAKSEYPKDGPMTLSSVATQAEVIEQLRKLQSKPKMAETTTALKTEKQKAAAQAMAEELLK